jgi:hypothetical protein
MVREVGVIPAHEDVAEVFEQSLSTFLRKQHGRCSIDVVLNSAVAFADDAMVAPQRIHTRNEESVLVLDPRLRLRTRQSGVVEEHARTRLQGRLTPTVGQGQRSRCSPKARPTAARREYGREICKRRAGSAALRRWR